MRYLRLFPCSSSDSHMKHGSRLKRPSGLSSPLAGERTKQGPSGSKLSSGGNVICTAFLLSLLPFVSTPALAGDDSHEPRVITVTGQAELKAEPDEAIVTVTLRAMDMSMKVAKAAYDRQMNTLLKAAEEFDIEKKYLRTQRANIRPIYRHESKTNKRIFEGYEISGTVSVTLKEMEKSSVLVDTLVNKGFEYIDGIQFTVSNREALEEDALMKALENAKTKAKRMVKVMGAELGDVLVIQENAYNAPQPVYLQRHAMMMESAGAPAADFALPGEQTIQRQIHVEFEIDD